MRLFFAVVSWANIAMGLGYANQSRWGWCALAVFGAVCSRAAVNATPRRREGVL